MQWSMHFIAGRISKIMTNGALSYTIRYYPMPFDIAWQCTIPCYDDVAAFHALSE